MNFDSPLWGEVFKLLIKSREADRKAKKKNKIQIQDDGNGLWKIYENAEGIVQIFCIIKI